MLNAGIAQHIPLADYAPSGQAALWFWIWPNQFINLVTENWLQHMSTQVRLAKYTPGLAEPVGYAAVAIMMLALVSAILDKGGVPPTILTWAVFSIVVIVVVLSANAFWPARFSGYAIADRAASAPLIANAQLMAVAPACLVLAYLSQNADAPNVVLLTLMAFVAALWLSTLTLGVPMNRSGAYNLPEFLEARFQSSLVRFIAVVLIAAPLFLLVCGQLLAFASIAEILLGLAPIYGIPVCLGTVVCITWLSGIRGVLLASAVGSAILMIGFTAYYLFFSAGLPLSKTLAEQLAVSLREISSVALPFLPKQSLPGGSYATQIVYVLGVAMAFSVSPIFTQFHPLASTGLKTIRSALASTLLIVVSSVIVFVVVPVGGLFFIGNGDVTASAATPVPFAEIAILASIPVTGAVLLFGFSGLISFDGFRGLRRRPASENGRLISTRMTVLLSAGLAGWITLGFGPAAVVTADAVLFVAMAAVFPCAIAATWWRNCSAIAACVGMLVGGITTMSLWAASNGVIDLSALVLGRSPVIDFLSGLTSPAAGLIGAMFNALAIGVVSLLPNTRSAKSEAFFEAIHEDRHIRPLNETAL